MNNGRFYPSVAVGGIADITAELLEKHNIKGLILDIDNTLVPNHTPEADEKTEKWIEGLMSAGYKMCIVSNARKRRVEKFNSRLKLPAVYNAMKPRMAAFTKAARIMGLESRHVAVVGDQVFTDIYGGNRAGMFTILVNPLDSRENMLIRFKRIFERRILKKYEEMVKQAGKSD
ncbi:MAG: YqeG family HAD IIIA-type phosphatase [Bacillota bacterium]